MNLRNLRINFFEDFSELGPINPGKNSERMESLKTEAKVRDREGAIATRRLRQGYGEPRRLGALPNPCHSRNPWLSASKKT